MRLLASARLAPSSSAVVDKAILFAILRCMKLVKESSGVYVTEDGRYEVSTGVSYTYCENPHPVQISREVRRQIREETVSGQHRATIPWEIEDAVLSGKRGYQCPGDVEHAVVSWGVWDRQKDDYVSDASSHFDTKREAVSWLEGHLAHV